MNKHGPWAGWDIVGLCEDDPKMEGEGISVEGHATREEFLG